MRIEFSFSWIRRGLLGVFPLLDLPQILALAHSLSIAEQLHGPDRDAAWRQITAASQRFADYQSKTDRELPIIRLMSR